MSVLKIAKNTIYFGLIPKLSLLVSVLILPLTTPYLSTYDYGISGVVSSYTNLILCIAPLGLYLHLTNSFFENKQYNLLWSRVLGLYLISGFFFGVVNVIILSFTLPIEDVGKLLLLCIVGSVQIFLFANSNIASSLFPLLGRPKPMVFTNLFASLCGLAVSFVMIYYYKLGYWGLVANHAVCSIVSFLAYIPIIWKRYHIIPIFKQKWNRTKCLLKEAIPLVPHSLGFVLLTSSARIVMSIYKIDYDEIGLYSHGCNMGDYIVIITTALSLALAPAIQRTYRGHDFTSYRKLYYLSQGVALLGSFLVCIWMNEIYGVLIRNESLRQSASIATFMCFAQVQTPFYTYLSTSCFVDRRTTKLLWLVFVPGAMNFLLCFSLIPLFGYRVAVYSTMFSYWSQILIPFLVPYFRDKTREWLGTRKKLVILYLLIIVLLTMGNFINGWNLLPRIIVSIAIISLSYLVGRRNGLFSVV